jgi:1,4-dihydroxy-2-naphthoate octaprenyltransferase
MADYRDFKNGIDTKESLGSSGMLVNSLVDPERVFGIGIISFFIASLVGLCAAFLRPLLFPFGLIAASLCFFYSEGPIAYKYRRFGELAVFLVWGPILFSVCSISLVEFVDFGALRLSVISGVLTTMVLLSNNLRDYEYDRVHNKTLVTAIGLKYGYFLLYSLIGVVLILPFIYSSYGLLPNNYWFEFVAFIFVALAMKNKNKRIFAEYFVWLDLAYCGIYGIQLLFW